jgi:hypothetical protein
MARRRGGGRSRGWGRRADDSVWGRLVTDETFVGFGGIRSALDGLVLSLKEFMGSFCIALDGLLLRLFLKKNHIFLKRGHMAK